MLDQLSDQNINWVLKGGEIPDYVLDSPELTAQDAATLPDRAFAGDRKFPIFDKSATYLSARYAAANGLEKNAALIGRLRKASELHGILEDFEQLFPSVETLEKSAAAGPAPKNHALEIVDDDGTCTKVYPIGTNFDLDKSARQLLKDFAEDKLDIRTATRVAEVMFEKAASVGVPEKLLPQKVIRWGENRVIDLGLVKSAIELRKSSHPTLVNDAMVGVYEDLLEMVKQATENGSAGPDIDEYLDMWDDVDRVAGIPVRGAIMDAHQTFHQGPRTQDLLKFASSVVFVGDVPVPADVFCKLGDGALDYFGPTEAGMIKAARRSAAISPADATGHIAELPEDSRGVLLRQLLACAH